jgi:hypothetical protein
MQTVIASDAHQYPEIRAMSKMTANAKYTLIRARFPVRTPNSDVS